jgi:ligand-binding sensor domain-containing protein
LKDFIYMIVLIFLAGLNAHSQKIKYTYKNFDERDGICSSTMFGMAQDKDGFIWVGTDNGFHRYDGYKFVQIKSPIDTKNNNIANQLTEVMFDSVYNRLWLMSLTDFQYLDLNNYTFHRWFDMKKYPMNIISQKNQAKIEKDEILFSIGGDLFQYSILNKSVKEVTTQYGLEDNPNNRYAFLKSTHQDYISVICPKNVMVKNLKSGELLSVKALEGEIFLDVMHDDDYIFIASFEGLITYHLPTGARSKRSFPYFVKGKPFNHNIVKVHHFDPQTLILSGMGGHILYNKVNRTYQYFQQEKGDYENRVNAYNFLNDREGNLWRSSIHEYCNVLYYQNRKMILIDSIINEKGVNVEPYRNMRLNDSIFAFCGSGISGIGLFNQQTGKYQIINNDFNHSAFVYDMVKLNDGQVYTSTPKDIFSYEMNNHKFKPVKFKINRKFESISGVKYFYKIGDNKAVGVNASTVYIIDFYTKRADTINISTYLRSKKDVSSYSLIPFYFHDGNLYLGGEKNLYALDIKKQKISLAWENNSGVDIDILKFVRDMQLDRSGKIWISTLYNGVIIYDPSSQKWKMLNKDNSCMSNNNVSELVLDSENRMWAMNIDKFYLFDTKSFKCLTSKDKKEGFPKLGYCAQMAENDQMMTFNNYPTIQMLDFTNNPINIKTRPTIITSIKLNERDLLNVPLKKDTAFSFLYNENNISFSFTNLCFNNSHNNQYKYKLELIDSTWITSAQPFVEYKRLPSGNYTFSLQSSNNEGIWDPHIQKIYFSIQPIFYKSWWFVLLMSMSALGLLYFYYHLKTNRIKSEVKLTAAYQKKIAEIEMKALRAQMNPHFIFNSLNSIQKFIFEKDEYAASQYLTKFSRLIRLILEHSNQEFVTISSEMEMLKYYIEMEQLRFSNKFEYTLTKSNDVNDSDLIPSMVIQPHVENAIWHGLMHKDESCQLTVVFSKYEDHAIQIVIEDNGVGRTKAEEMKSKHTLKKKSFGSQISNDRIKYFSDLTGSLAKVDIMDKFASDGSSEGTKVMLILPTKKEV